MHTTLRHVALPVILIAAVAGGGSRGVNAGTSPAPVGAPATTTPSPNAPAIRDIALPAGTILRVRLTSSLSSAASRVEDPVDATLIAPVRIGRTEVLPAGSHVSGNVVAAERAGNVKGRGRLALRFTTLTVGGDTYRILSRVSRIAPATKSKDAEKIGIPAAGGAIIGALLGGKKGAAAGAAVGGGAGTAVVLSTPGKDVSLPRGAVLSLRLQNAVTVRVPG